MVGFVHRDDDEEESSNLSSFKLKNTVDPTWSDKFDFLDQFVHEVDDLSAPANASFLDFDSIKDWLEEMQDPEFNPEAGVIETRSELAPILGGDVLVERLDGIDKQLAAVDDSKEVLRKESEVLEDSLVDKGACFVKTEQQGAVDDSGEGLENSPTEKGACFVKTEQLDGIDEQLVAGDDSGEGLGNLRVEKGGDGEELVSLNTVVEEGLGKVSLVDEVELNPVDESSGSESETESSDSSSSSSGEDDDGMDEGEDKEVSKEVKKDLEEGEIMETDEEDGDDDVNEADIFNEEFLMDDEDDDEGGGVKEPIMSKNELKVLPHVPPVDVTLQPSHQMLPVGFVSSILGAQVIVEGADKHNPLSEGSILWMTEKRSPLGRVDEIFGPVKNPYYIVRYNSESEVPEGMHEGILVSFVPEFVDHVLNNKYLYQKGYDASGDNDEEVDEAEFSDDEKEAEYRRMMKMSKRGNNTDMKPGGNKKSNKSFKRNDVQSRNYHQSNSSQDSPPVQAGNMQNQRVESHVRHPTDHSNQPGSSRFSPAYNSGPGMIPGHPQPGQPAGFTTNGPRPNGMPFQMQSGEFANGFQMPWIQQQQFQQLPMMNSGPPFQQAFTPAGPGKNNMVPSYSPFPAGGIAPNAMNQDPFLMALQAQLAQFSILSGVLSNGLLTGQGGAGCNNMQQFPPNLQQNAGGNNMQQFPPNLQQNAGGNNMQHLPPNLQQNAGGNNMQHIPPNLQQNAEAPPPPQFNQGAGAGAGSGSGSGPSRPGGRPFQRGGGRSGGRGGRRGRGRGHPFQAR